MAKIKYDVRGVDPGGDRELPKPGVYRCKLISLVDAKPEGKDRRLEAQYQITDGPSRGFVLYDYVNLESEASKWKLAQFVKAMGLGDSGSLDPDELVGTGLSVRVRIQPGTEQYAAAARPATLIALDGSEDEPSEDLDDDDATDDTEESADDEAYTEEDLNELDDDDLKEVAEEFEIDVDEHTTTKKVGKKTKTTLDREAIVAAILAAQGDDEEESEGHDAEADAEDDSEDWSEEDLNELSDEDLLLYAFGGEDEDGDEVDGLLDEDSKAEYVVKKKVGKKTKTTVQRDELIAAMLEAQGEGEEGDDEAPDYESMDLPALKALAKERDLAVSGTKKVLIARLQKDDKPF